MEEPALPSHPITIPKGQISILAGASGAGKTTLLVQALGAWERGEAPFLHCLTWNATRVAYLVADRTKEEVVARLAAEGVGSKIEVYGLVDDMNFDLKWIDNPAFALTQGLKQFKQPFDLLIIDPIMLFLGGNVIDYGSVAVALVRLNRLAIQLGITILAAHHTTKGRTDYGFNRPQDRISGSMAFLGYSGTQMVLIEGRETGEDWSTLHVIPHTMPAMETYLQRGQGGLFYACEKTSTMDLIKEGPADTLVSSFLAGRVTGAVFGLRELHEAADAKRIARRTVFRYLADACESGLVEKIGKGEYVKK